MVSSNNRNTIDNLNQDDLIKLYKFIKMVLSSNRLNYSQQLQLQEISNYIESKLQNKKITTSGSSLSEREFNQAKEMFGKIGIGSNNYTESDKDKSGFFDGLLGTVGLFLVVAAIAIVKAAYEGLVSLWNSGILQIIIGATAIGTGVYFGYKKGLFEKLKEKFDNRSRKRNNSNNRQNVKTKSKSKEIIQDIKYIVKGLTIYASALTTLVVGAAHLNKHSDILNGTFLEDLSVGCRGLYEKTYRLVREKKYEFTNDYSEFENRGYIYNKDYSHYNNLNNLDYYDSDVWFVTEGDWTWEELSNYCYGDVSFANELRLYNAYYDFNDEILHDNTTVFVPSLEKLEEYIEGKRLIKKVL